MRHYFLFFMLLLSASVTATPITKKRARIKAQQFASERRHMKSEDIQMAYSTTTEKGDTALFVFNVGKQHGFVIVANDDEDDGIFGYSDEGTFDADNIPDNMKAWLNHCTATVSAKNRLEPAIRKAKSLSAIPRTVHPTEVIEPLITSEWGQWFPFNTKCPVIKGDTCPTGCTATAMAQVMRYYRTPTTYCSGIPSYVARSTNLKIPALPATKFNWDIMPDRITDDTPQNSIDEVAKLMRYCGQATDMNYNPTGSGAYTFRIPERLPLYFDYPSTIHYEYRESYDEQGWDSLLVSELVKRQPVIYTAYTNLGQGHTFICDGYDGKGFYHINWGWVGVGNGYFRISEAFAKDENLNPNVKNYHLSMSQTALIGIKATGEDDYVAPAKTFRAYTRPSLKHGKEYQRESATGDFSDICVKQSFVNTSSTTKDLPHGMALYDDDGKMVSILASASTSITSGGMKNYEATGIAFGQGLENGHYTIKAVYKAKANGDWIVMGGTDRNYIDVTINDQTMSLIPMPKADFIVDDVRIEDKFMVIDFSNINEEFYGPIYLRKYSKKTGTVEEVANDVIAFDALSSRTFELYLGEEPDIDLTADTYYLSVDEYKSQYFYTNEQTDKADIAKTIEIRNLNAEETTILGDRIMCEISLTNDGEQNYDNTFILSMADTEGNIDEVTRETLQLAPGETVTKYLEIPMTDFYLGREIFLKASHLNGNYIWVSDSTDKYHTAKGAIYWTKEGEVKTKEAAYNFRVPEEAVAINIRNASNKITPNSNPNTIYMLGNTMPNGLSGKNIVNAKNEGTTLNLTDGYDYFFPVEMIFSGKVTYKRTLAECDSIGWTTLSLPFAPQRATIDDKDVVWSESEEDTHGTMWLVEMTGVSDTTIVTSFAQAIEAGIPYLIAYADTLAEKTVTFDAENVTISSSTQLSASKEMTPYRSHGSRINATVPKSYLLSGDKFVYNEEGNTTAPFFAYLTCDTIGSPATLAIDLCQPKEKTDTVPEDIPGKLIKGDANDDGNVNVTDVMTVVKYILGQDVPSFNFKAADMDESESVEVTDIMLIVKYLLGALPDNGSNTPSDDNGENTPSDDNGENTPTDDNGENTPTDDNGENTPTDGNGENTPTDDNGENTPTDDNGDDKGGMFEPLLSAPTTSRLSHRS